MMWLQAMVASRGVANDASSCPSSLLIGANAEAPQATAWVATARPFTAKYIGKKSRVDTTVASS